MGEVNAPELLAVLEVLDREGQVRQSHRITSWPVRIGRALDNDLSLSDPHVAAHHAVIDHDVSGLVLQALPTHNGVQIGRRRLRDGERELLRDDGAPVELTAGRTHLRLRRASEALAPELPLAAAATWMRRTGPTLAAGTGLALALAFSTWLDSDPDTFARALGAAALTAVMGAALWVALWALLSKTFTRQTHADWHLKVFLMASLAWVVIAVVPDLLAFSLSWPWAGDFGFVLGYAVGATALYYHLTAVEPARLRLMRSVAVLAFIGGVGLTLWSNHQRTDRLGAELYMSHLFPPALRVARPVPADRFVEGLAALQPVLDTKAKEAPLADGGTGGSDEE
jgi:hypothetical protein